jgi:hypothetical protein
LLTDSSKTVARHVITSLVAPSVAFLAWLFALRLVNQHNANVVGKCFDFFCSFIAYTRACSPLL